MQVVVVTRPSAGSGTQTTGNYHEGTSELY